MAGERARWAAAVLILSGILAIAGAVQQWPHRTFPARPAAPVLLAGRPLPAFEVPVLPRSVFVSAPAPRQVAEVTDSIISVTATTVAERPDIESLPAPAAATQATASQESAPALLPSRRLEIPAAPPVSASVELVADASADSHAFVELPAVVVTRGVTVAVRGIRSGLRATSAALRAAF